MSEGSHATLIRLEGKSSKSIKVLKVLWLNHATQRKLLTVYWSCLLQGNSPV